MTMADIEHDDDRLLEQAFAAARRDAARMPEGLADRMVADALAAQSALLSRSAPPRPRGVLRQFADTIGGWYGLGGMAAASVAGLWLGFAPPLGLPDPAGLVIGSEDETSIFLSVDELTSALSDGSET